MSLAQLVDVMALVRKKPRGVEELMQLTDMSEGTICSYMDLLRSEGHVYVCELLKNRRGSATPVYCWQETIHGERDVTVPTPRR